jgi:hypothetical protein
MRMPRQDRRLPVLSAVIAGSALALAGSRADDQRSRHDAPCSKKGGTHGGTPAPDLVTGCDVFFGAIGDLDYDGSPYWADWPRSLTAGPLPSCVLPPKGPGHFLPFFTLARAAGNCVWEFGNMSNGRSFGRDNQYGTVWPGTMGAFAGRVRSRPAC